MVRKTQSTVALNAKISSVNLQAIPTDGSASFAEGAPLARDSTTYKAIAPTGGDTYQAVYVNYVDSARSDITFTQGDPSGDATAPSRSIQSGGLTGIIGNGCEIGMPAGAWTGGVLPDVGQMVQVNASTKLFGGVSPAATMSHGIVTRKEQGYAFFLFYSVPSNGA